MENQCLYYTNFIAQILRLQRRLYQFSHRAAAKTPAPQAIDRGQLKPLEEVFIIVVYLISIF
jgi:hypothetical protein